jgi:hypothetical protein
VESRGFAQKSRSVETISLEPTDRLRERPEQPEYMAMRGIGLLVVALTVGSALPHLFNALPLLGEVGMPPWRSVTLEASGHR